MIPPTAPPMIEGDDGLFFEDVPVVIVEVSEGTELVERVVVLVLWVVLEEVEVGVWFSTAV